MDSYKKYKNSGIDWIGKIPEHWEIKKLKYLVTVKLQYGANEIAEIEDESFPRYIRITDFGEDGKLRSDTFKSLPIEIANEYLLKSGDILFARSGATVGKTFQFKNYYKKACFAGYLIKATPDEKKILSDYLYLFTKSKNYDYWKNTIFNQSTIQNIGADKYNFLLIPLPPLSEQKQIAKYLDAKCVEIDLLVAKMNNEVELLREYRTVLISDVVTGKVKVCTDVFQKVTETKPVRNPVFRRAVLAAEIVLRFHADKNFGRVKLMKLIYLLEHHVQINDLDMEWTRQLAGPYDPKGIGSIEKILKNNKWFNKKMVGKYVHYYPLAKKQGHQKYFSSYFGEKQNQIEHVLKLTEKLDTERCEIIATLYGAWNDLIIQNETVTDNRIIDEVRNHWHESKQRFNEERLKKALGWMRENQLIPTGWGNLLKLSKNNHEK
ncbi:MAG: restriction endonuclease subunit S [Planctomycetaceae bacterium]|jgi:hypothetical protein|nr:restriction endonuclease subunit S [Planctomycetaceae bacterium]